MRDGLKGLGLRWKPVVVLFMIDFVFGVGSLLGMLVVVGMVLGVVGLYVLKLDLILALEFVCTVLLFVALTLGVLLTNILLKLIMPPLDAFLPTCMFCICVVDCFETENVFL